MAVLELKCYGPSMEPTLRTKDVLLTEHISPVLKRIDIGDVVVARSPQDRRWVCKRVVAGPGDIVLYKNKTITIPKDFVWLEGDNKENSNDSRFYGPVPYSMVRRRCFCKIWPNLDFELEDAQRFYLESSPTEQQIARHRKKEILRLNQEQEKPKWLQDLSSLQEKPESNNSSPTTTITDTTNSSSSLITVIKNNSNDKARDEELFPGITPKEGI